MQAAMNEPSSSNRRTSRRKGKGKATQKPDGNAVDNSHCLNRKFCKGKHKKPEPNGSSEKLFENQVIKIVNTVHENQAVISELRRHLDEYNVLGFDCEWISQYRQYPVALLQLSSHRGLCALFRLCKLEMIPQELRELLEDETVVKVGIEPHKDAMKLMKDYGITGVKSTLDLNQLAKECGFETGGLGKLAEKHLKVQLDKNPCVCASDWEADELLDVQIDYAAKDARVSLELFKVFQEELKPKPVDCGQKQFVQQFIEEHCEKYLKFKENPNTKRKEKVDHFENQKIIYVKTVDECLDAMKLLKSHYDEYNVLGFKLLTTINNSAPVRLLQLASHRRLSVIVQLNDNFVTLPTELQEILEDKKILKVSVTTATDTLNKYRISGSLDLNFLLSIYSNKALTLSLPNLSKQFLKLKLDEQPSKKLLIVEKNLVTNDAHISIELFKEFVKRLEPKSDVNLNEFIEKYCMSYLDIAFDGKLTEQPSRN